MYQERQIRVHARRLRVVPKIGDDYFDDLQGKPGGRRTVCC